MKKLLITSATLLVISLTSCYYDKENELYPSTGCATTTATFNADIVPIISTNCSYSGCHDATTIANGMDLSNYAGMKAIALSGQLMGSITHATGYQPMPKNTAKLSDCNISRIKSWVDAGALNN